MQVYKSQSRGREDGLWIWTHGLDVLGYLRLLHGVLTVVLPCPPLVAVGAEVA